MSPVGDNLTTEQRQPGLADLDLRSTIDLVRLVNEQDALVPAAVARSTQEIAAVVDAVTARMRSGGRLVYLGAGAAGWVAAADAFECRQTYGCSGAEVVAIVAGPGPDALQRGWWEDSPGAEDDRDAAERDLAAIELGEHDSLVVVSASGQTPYALAAAGAARRRRALAVGVTANTATPLAQLVDHTIEVVVGPEIVAGSTRMKAATAQKLVLHTLSTLVMVRTGRTYGDLMVGIRPDNAKLRGRAIRIVVEATGADEQSATAALGDAAGDARIAIVSLVARTDAEEARRRLERSAWRVRDALGDGRGV
jgi:N-acetylmuramic acid 6-phosphate etherase